MGGLALLGAGSVSTPASTPFNPADYGTVAVWLDCSDSTYCLDSGGSAAAPDEAVQTLTDRSGNSRSGLQTTGARQGLWRASVKNSLGAIDVTQSSSNWYQLQNSLGLVRNVSGMTFAYVLNPDDISQFFCTIAAFTENSSWDPRVRIRLIDQNGTDYRFSFSGVRSDSDSLTTVTPAVDFAKNNWHILVVVVDYANALLSMYVDGTAIYSPTAFLTAGSTDNTDSQIGPPLCIQDPGLNFAYDGYLGECIIYQSALDATNRGNLTTALGTKWDITVA